MPGEGPLRADGWSVLQGADGQKEEEGSMGTEQITRVWSCRAGAESSQHEHTGIKKKVSIELSVSFFFEEDLTFYQALCAFK